MLHFYGLNNLEKGIILKMRRKKATTVKLFYFELHKLKFCIKKDPTKQKVN